MLVFGDCVLNECISYKKKKKINLNLAAVQTLFLFNAIG